jgi:transposase-like protein
VWLYFRFTLSFRDVEDLLSQRGIEVSYETVRCWTIKFGPAIARTLKRGRPVPSPRWHLDEMVSSIGGKRVYVWRAVDDEGEVLDVVVQQRRGGAVSPTATRLQFTPWLDIQAAYVPLVAGPLICSGKAC